MESYEETDYEVINQTAFLKNEDDLEIKLEIYHRIARQMWAIIVLLVQLHLGVRPRWNKK